MLNSRRQFFRRALGGAGLMAGATALAIEPVPSDLSGHSGKGMPSPANPPIDRAWPEGEYLPVETPDLPKLAYTLENGVKVFNLVAEPVKREFVPGRRVDAWGYNGTAPGPTIEVVQGDRVRLIVDNHLPEPTSMHWHGFEIPIEMDGVEGISQPLIPPGGRFVYDFTLHQAGTFFYHSHMAMQEMMGLIGLFIMHPKEAVAPPVDRDFGLILQEWAVLPSNTVPNSMSMEFNWLTLNGRSGPATTPLIAKVGHRVRIRLVNLGMDHHPIHLHGNTFCVTGTEGGRVPAAAWTPANTVLVGVAQARDIEFEAKYPGDWMLHCHMPHHMMNQMASMVGPMLETGRGLKTGMGMPEGMGMLQQGSATDEVNGPSLGRSIGIGAEHEKATTNAPLEGQPPPGAGMASMSHGGSTNPWQVPGYPQDMAMAMSMPMEGVEAKPENYGLAAGWSAGMMGMMTLMRVLPPGLYDEVMARVKARG